jgi:hypothetical protein
VRGDESDEIASSSSSDSGSSSSSSNSSEEEDDPSVESCSSSLALGKRGEGPIGLDEVLAQIVVTNDDEYVESDDESQEDEDQEGLYEGDDDDEDDSPFHLDREANKQTVENFLKLTTDPLTQGQRDQTWHHMKRFRISGTSSSAIFINSPHTRQYLIKGSDRDDGKQFSKLEMLQMMMKSWFSHNVSTESMKRGQVNEDPVCNAIRGMKALKIRECFECGLYCHPDKPWHAVSPDGILFFECVEHDKDSDDVAEQERYWREAFGSLEIKSAIAASAVVSAMEYASVEPYHVVFGEGDFFKYTEKEHRAQLLMQAYVLDASKVLYVRATETGVHTVVLVDFPGTVLRDAELALRKYDSAIKWLHAKKLKFPQWLPKESNEYKIIESHWPFWNSLCAKQKEIGPLPPIRVFRNGTQVLYNKAKTGVDGLTQSTNHFRSQTSKLKWEQNVATKSLRRPYHGAFVSYRLIKNKSYVANAGEYKGLII